MALRLAALRGHSFALRLPLATRAGRFSPAVFRSFSDAAANGKPPNVVLPEFRIVKTPTVAQSQEAPQAFRELSHEAIYVLAERGDHLASEERLRRNVMAVDGIDYSAAGKKMREIRASSVKYVGLATVPYKVGIAAALVTGVGSVPMVFEYNLASWFNDNFATEEVPPIEELQTVYEIGTWTWNWMEPILGTLSFTLLALQFSRNQMLNLDIRPYTGWVKKQRSRGLAKMYPNYNTHFIIDYAMTANLNVKPATGSSL